MRYKFLLTVFATVFAIGWVPRAVVAVELPCRAVKLIVPWGAGGGTDVIFRVVANTAQRLLGKDIIVQNIGGQGGNKGAKAAKASRLNGCTLFAGHDSMQTSYVQARVDFSYFAFEPIVLLTHTPSLLGAHPGVPWNSEKSLSPI